jgi:hypothetical protein
MSGAVSKTLSTPKEIGFTQGDNTLYAVTKSKMRIQETPRNFDYP